jgi:DNA polymerase (family 10)
MALGIQYIVPELREGLNEVDAATTNSIPDLIEYSDIRGSLHNHSTYSDGHNTLREMAEYCKGMGLEYLGICDHSKSAFYANGLSVERIRQQHAEIDHLNSELEPFRIFKGIESDILSDGSLDYTDDILGEFDFVVASIHSNLRMDIDKATSRIITAVSNPFTTILGHPTGRLLLAREGYPVDHKAVIDACADHGVVIELNAHPYRLDLDWRWIRYAISKGVKISVNPDAHSTAGFHDMYYGVCAGRKGFLSSSDTLNCYSLDDIDAFFRARKSAIQAV